MNLIVFSHFVTPASGASHLDTALGLLGTWFDAEIGSLEDLLDIMDHEDAIDDIEALHALHLDAAATPEDIRRLLEGAQVSVERLLKRVRAIAFEGRLAGPTPSTVDAWVHRSGARLEDILATLDRALVA